MINKRHETIKKLICEKDISTQQELAKELNALGYNVTQATVSRDIKQLNIRKVNPGDASHYALPEEKTVPVHFINVLKDGFVSAEVAMNILVIKTVPGMAMAVAAALDAFSFPEIVGTIAGDDTIMCAIKDIDAAKNLKKRIYEILK